MSRSRIAVVIGAVSLGACAEKPRQPADLIVVAQHIYTSDSTKPTADAFASTGGRIVYVGSKSGAMAYKDANTSVVDVGNATVLAGLVDAHGHVLNLGVSLRTVKLQASPTYDEVIARVVAKAKTTPKGEWIIGRGWDQNLWPDKKFPTHEKLSAAVPDNPVFLTRIDGHAGLANAAAMRLAKMSASTRDPSGGHVERDAKGAPAGVFVDNALGLIERVIPPATHEQVKNDLLAAQQEIERWGLTGVHDAGEGKSAVDAYTELGQAGQLSARFYVMLADEKPLLDEWFRRNPALGLFDGKLTVRMIKAYMDGAMGSRGAALLAPYADDPKQSGLLRTTPEHIRELADQALAHGYQLGVHAIGDRANRLVLDAYEGALKAHPNPDARFRIEHAQNLAPADIPRFKALGVIPSMQASHQTSDMYWVKDRLGDARIGEAYPWASLLKTGVIVPNGSDFPVEMVNPLISFHSAISRQDAKNEPAGGWHPEERMTRQQALLSMTLWPAVASFQEKDLGSISVGKRADFTVLDQDIMTVPFEQVLATKAVATYVGGKKVFGK